MSDFIATPILGRWIVVCAVLLVSIRAEIAESQSRFESWTTENGLPQNSVNDILQTRDGYLWLATFGGLVRFDGVRFVVFDRSVAGIDNQRVFALHEDRTGTLWAGAENGMVIRYRRGVFTTFTQEDGLPPGVVHRIEEAEDGALWINAVGGIARFDGERFVARTPNDFSHQVEAPPPTRYLDVWWREDAGVLHALVKGRVRTYAIRELIGNAQVTRVTVDRRGNLWINTNGNCVVKASGERIQKLTARDGLPPGHSEGLFFEGSGGETWFGDGRQIYRIAGGTHERLQLPGMPNSGFRSFYVDNEGSTWIGTTTSGLHRLTHAPVTLYDARDGVSLRVAYTILQDRAGVIWVSAGGLHRYAGGRFATVNPSDGFSGLVRCLYEDSSGTVWMGTDRGLASLQNGKWTPYEDRSGYLQTAVAAMVQDKAGTYWYGTVAGLVSVNRHKVERYTAADGLSHNRVTALFEDREGALWIGTFQGLTRLANGQFRRYTAREGFIGSDVRALHQDRDGVMWIGTYDGGLYRLAGERLTRFTRADGLHDNGVFQILEDDNGFLWTGSNRGIQRVSRRELNDMADGRRRRLTPVVLGTKDGLATVEVNGGAQPAGLKTADGKLWFPTMGGLAVVDPADAASGLRTPKVLIEEVRVAGSAVDASSAVQVPSDAPAIDIRYTAPTFVSAGFVRFRHRLVGLQNDWNEAGERRDASFYGLPPGRYTFQVIASGNGGEWSADGASLQLVVLPPFWRTSWFLGLNVSAIVALAFAAHRVRVRHLQRLRVLGERFSQRLIENQERERARISGDMHDSLGQGLRIIRKLARAAQQAAPGGQPSEETFAEISGLAERVQSEITEIAYGLRPHHLDTLGLSKTIESMIRRVERSGDIRFVTDVAAVDDLIPTESRIHLFRIIQEAVSNIAQHSNATEALVALAADGRRIHLRIEDNGVGISSAKDDTARDSANGFGLMGMRERARILGAHLTVQSAPGGGTAIVMTLPLERSSDD
jgi:signal transduction histidine kinase/ligand-binding sensor domain-containing protein